MRLIYKYQYKDKENKLLPLCQISKNLYNQANYIIKQELKNNKKWIRYNELDKIMKVTKNLKNEINYRLLKAQVSQQVLKQLDNNWKSYFKAIKDYKSNAKKYKGKPKVPKYKKHTNMLIYTNQSASIKDNKIYLSKDIIIDIPKYKDFNKFQQIRILHLYGNIFEIEIIYEEECKNIELDYEKYASIDLGLNNLITLVSQHKPLLISGKQLKSYNQYYNKRKAYLQSIKDKMNIKDYTKQLRILELNRKNYIKDYLHKVSRIVINYLIHNRIGTLAVGYNKGCKDCITLGNKNNQAFVLIPLWKLVNYLRYKCELVGIRFEVSEESYTSKCDALVLEKLERKEEYVGKRLKRGLFQSSIGKLINADINAALNILRKVVNDSVAKQIIDTGLLFNPVKIRNLFSISLQTKMLKILYSF